MKQIKFRLTAYTDPAGKRNDELPYKGNEDNFYVDADLSNDVQGEFSSDKVQVLSKQGCLLTVADGMGGHNAGDFASKTTVETMVRKIRESSQEKPVRALENAIEEANSMIRKKACERPELEGMGTTVVAAFCADGRLEAANVGDSRLYIVNETIRQITRDHSLVEEMVRMGGIPREQARNHPDKNIITRAVGAADTVEPDFFSEEIKKGDLVLLCSDGLTNMLEDEEIRQIISGGRDIAEI